MNLEAALSTMTLQRSVQRTQGDGSRLGIAQMVFDMAAAQGEPFENLTMEEWARKWLPSKTFTLVELRPNQVAVPYVNRIASEKIQSLLAQSEEQIQPIVVDVNKNGIGQSNGGYTPRVIVVDGKHRHRAQVMRGKDKIMAWVGEMAMAELKYPYKVIRDKDGKLTTTNLPESLRRPFTCGSKQEQRFHSTGDSINQLFASIAPPTGGMARQDSGDGGSRPTGGSRLTARGGGLGGGSGMNPARQGVFAQNSRSTGQLEKPDPSDVKATPDPSDTNQTFPDPSDRLQWDSKDPQLCAPGCGKDHQHHFGTPGKDAPGAGGSYTRLEDGGATNSEFNNPNLLKAYGTSAGVKKEWESRGRGKSEPNVEMNQRPGEKDRDEDSWGKPPRPFDGVAKNAIKNGRLFNPDWKSNKFPEREMEAGPLVVKRMRTKNKKK